MKKRIIVNICIILIILCGCSNQKGFEMKNTDFESDVQYNTVHGSTSTLIHNTENGIIAYYRTDGKNAPCLYPLFFEGNSVQDMVFNASSACSIALVEECDSLIEMDVSGVQYYKGQVYFLKEDYAGMEGYYDVEIIRSDLDGSNQKTIFEIENIEVDYEHAVPASCIQIHKDKVYLQVQYDLYIGSLDEKILTKVENEGIQQYWKIFFWEDIMYLTTSEYNDGKTVHFDAVLECDLNGNIKNMIAHDMLTMFVDSYNIFYKKIDENEKTTSYVYNRKKDTHIMLPMEYMYVLKYQDKYLLDTGPLYEYDEEEKTFMLYMDEDNTILDFIEYTNDTYYNEYPLLVEDRYYVYQGQKDFNKGWYAYYDIKDNKISEISEMKMMDLY